MRLIINGRSQEQPAVKTVQDVVECCQVANAIVLVNERVIPASAWAATVLAEGDALELVAIVGGG